MRLFSRERFQECLNSIIFYRRVEESKINVSCKESV